MAILRTFCLALVACIFQGAFGSVMIFDGHCDMLHPCSQMCVPSQMPNKIHCACFPGHVLSSNGFLCQEETIDIDSEIPATDTLISEDDEDMVEGSGSGDNDAEDGGDDGEGPEPTPYSMGPSTRQTTTPTTPEQVVELTCGEWPCEHGGSCYMLADTPRCHCPLGWEGAMCEDGVDIKYPRFDGDSFMTLPVETSKLYQSFYITISFKPETLNGRLLFASQGLDGQGDYMAIGLVNGKPVFRFDCGQGAAVISSQASIVPHQWHTLKVGRNLRHGWLQLDDAPAVKGSSPGTFSKVTLKGDLYIGGFNITAEARDGLKVKHMFQGFVGCIESIVITNVELDLRPHPKGSIRNGQNIGECSEGVCKQHVCANGGSCVSRSADQAMCLCPLGTHGSVCEELIEIHTPSFNATHASHLAHGSLGNKHLSFLQMEVIFKPREPSGILVYSGTETGDGDFFSITIDDRYISFKFDCGSGPAVLRSTQPVELHEWHIIEVSRTAREGILRVDNQPTVQALAPGAFTQTSFNTHLYIGGIDDVERLSKEIAVKNSFSGDIQRILINDDPIDLISEAVGGANVGNAHHECQGRPCLNGGECHPLHDSYVCDCRLSFKGANCEQDVEMPVREPHFSGRSYLWYASNEVTSRVTGERNIFSFDIKAEEPNGLVLWAGHASMTAGSDFIAIGMENGLLVLKFNLGGGEAVLSSRRPVNDGQWHTIRIDRLGTVGIMEVDDDNAVTGDASGESYRQLNVNDGLYIGGMDEITETTLNRYTNGLTGCMRNFKIDESLAVFSTETPDDGRSISHCTL